MKVFIALLYFPGLYGVNNHIINILFSQKHGILVLGGCMSRNNIEFIQAHISFDDTDTEKERWEKYIFAAIREFFEQCNKNFGKALIPEDYLSLDGTLYPT